MNSKRMVRFDKKVRINGVPNISDLPQEEIDSIWFSREELADIRKRNRKLSRKMANSHNIERRCMHGLYTPEAIHRRRHLVRQGQLCVLMEQEKQWDNNDHQDPERLAWIYSRETTPHLDAARVRALKHAEETTFDALSTRLYPHDRKALCVKRRLLLEFFENENPPSFIECKPQGLQC
jgi:hypothetical protein